MTLSQDRRESADPGPPGRRAGNLLVLADDLPTEPLRLAARRELKLQETLLESMLRQFEIAKLDEAKEGPMLQQVDVAMPPDRKSKPARALIVALSVLGALLLASLWVVWHRYAALRRELDPAGAAAWTRLRDAWRWKRA